MNYYNEFDPKAAGWLYELIHAGVIPNGIVDVRSITDVEPCDIKGFTQHHFFAGIGGWSLALQLAGWPGDIPVWTGSCPCQPFSTAGKNKGTDDERHLWPYFYELIRKCTPDTIFGEQVEGAIKHGWLDDLQTDLEEEGYAVGHCVLGAHSINSAHIRQRLYWVANSIGDDNRREIRRVNEETNSAEISDGQGFIESRELSGTGENVCGMGDTSGATCERDARGVYRAEKEICSENRLFDGTVCERHTDASKIDWIYCRDNKYRPIKSGIKPLVNGLPKGMVYSGDSSISPNETQEARVMRLKGYGNAIVPGVAAEFIKAFMEVNS